MYVFQWLLIVFFLKYQFDHVFLAWPKIIFGRKKNHFWEKQIFFGRKNNFWEKKYFLAEKMIFERKKYFWPKKTFFEKIYGRKNLWTEIFGLKKGLAEY